LVIVAQQDEGISELGRAARRKVAVVQGYSSEEWLRKDYPELDLLLVDTVEQGFAWCKRVKLFAWWKTYWLSTTTVQSLFEL
jgi:hypothetical protein